MKRIHFVERKAECGKLLLAFLRRRAFQFVDDLEKLIFLPGSGRRAV